MPQAMASPAEPFTELFHSAALTFADARNALDSSQADKPDSDTLAYSNNGFITGLELIGRLVRKYLVSQEARDVMRGERNNAMPIVTNLAFRNAAETVVVEVEAAKHLLSAAGATRIASTVRQWLETRSPDKAQLLGSQCDTTMRMLKRKAR